MKSFAKFIILAAAFASVLETGGFAQLGQNKGFVGKIYVAETKGGGTIESKGQVYEPKQATAFDAAGTVMVTNADSNQAYVLSNGAGLYLDSNTQVNVNQFDQERFQPTPNASDVEPSVSHTTMMIPHGMVGICTSRMVSGTTMVISTPLVLVNVRGRRVAIQVTPTETDVYLLEGSVTVRTGEKDAGGLKLQPGEQAVIRPGPPGQPAVSSVEPMDNATRSQIEAVVTVSCNARKTVSFDTSSDAPDEIVAKPMITSVPPNNLTVSPDRINPGN